MKVYLDDERKTPDGWVRCYWPEEVISLLKTGNVTVISLDHDLGEGREYEKPRTGKDVLVWLEEQVKEHGFKPPQVWVHSMNPVGRIEMDIIRRRIIEFDRLNRENEKEV